MLNLSLGSGIMIASLFMSLATIGVVWINNYYKSKNQTGMRAGDRPTSKNGFVRKGECDATMSSLQRELQNNHKENKNWWKQVDEKIDKLSSELSEIRKTNENYGQRIAALEAISGKRN